MEGRHVVVTCTLTVNDQEIPTYALIDCRAMGIALMDHDFACHRQIPQQELKERKPIEVIDGRPIESRDITHIAKVGMKMKHHGEQLPITITKLGNSQMFEESLHYNYMMWRYTLHPIPLPLDHSTVLHNAMMCQELFRELRRNPQNQCTMLGR
jgi:hypothetical protein